MERRAHHLALLLGLLLVWAATGAQALQPVCDPAIIATQIALSCMADPDMPTAPCCELIIASVDRGGGVPCLCRVAAQPQLVLGRVNATHLLALYASCGGQHTGDDANLAAACQAAGPSPPAATDSTIAPLPPATPCHKHPTREDPLPPPRSEKSSPSPLQKLGSAAAAASDKSVPTSEPSAAFSPVAPAAAPTTPTPPHSGSASDNTFVVSAALLACAIVIFVILD